MNFPHCLVDNYSGNSTAHLFALFSECQIILQVKYVLLCDVGGSERPNSLCSGLGSLVYCVPSLSGWCQSLTDAAQYLRRTVGQLHLCESLSQCLLNLLASKNNQGSSHLAHVKIVSG